MFWKILTGTAVSSIFAYLIGNFSFSIIIVKLLTHKDVRDQGSKNAGATNASRVIGKKWGAFIVMLDAIKIIFAILITLAFSQIKSPYFQNTNLIVPAFFALIGHCWPVFYKFRGGKAVSCFVGLIFLVNYIMGIAIIIIWLILLFTSRKVSVASIFSSIIIAILMWIPQVSNLSYFDINGQIFLDIYKNNVFTPIWYNKLHNLNGIYTYDSFLTINIIVTLSMIVIIIRHLPNIRRLINKTEPCFINKKNNLHKNKKCLQTESDCIQIEDNLEKENQKSD